MQLTSLVRCVFHVSHFWDGASGTLKGNYDKGWHILDTRHEFQTPDTHNDMAEGDVRCQARDAKWSILEVAINFGGEGPVVWVMFPRCLVTTYHNVGYEMKVHGGWYVWPTTFNKFLLFLHKHPMSFMWVWILETCLNRNPIPGLLHLCLVLLAYLFVRKLIN